MKTIYSIFISVFFISSCAHKIENDTISNHQNEAIITLTDEQINNIGITTDTISYKTLSSTIQLMGKIDVPPQNMISISMPLGGYLKSTHLLPGMHVKKGEVIAIMEDEQYVQLQEEYLTAKSKLEYLEKEYERQKELNKNQASSDKTFQLALSEYQTQKIKVKSLSEKLKLIFIDEENLNENNLSKSIKILSPIDGYVSKVNINIGKHVEPSDILFELVNPQDIHLALIIYEKDIDKVYNGQRVLAFTNNNPDKKYPCELILIGKDFSNERNIIAHCHFEKYDNSLIPGMFMNAILETNTKNVPALPNEAILNFEGHNYIFIRNNYNDFEMQEIKIGNSENNYTEIISDNLQSIIHKKIVVKGAYQLLMAFKNKEEE
jgi:cobalt-zinc-cadmium efflux system membrane fusion protein